MIASEHGMSDCKVSAIREELQWHNETMQSDMPCSETNKQLLQKIILKFWLLILSLIVCPTHVSDFWDVFKIWGEDHSNYGKIAVTQWHHCVYRVQRLIIKTSYIIKVKKKSFSK